METTPTNQPVTASTAHVATPLEIIWESFSASRRPWMTHRPPPWPQLAVVAFLVTAMLAVSTPRGHAQAHDYLVIVHPSNTVSSLSRAEVAGFFFRRTTRWSDGRAAEPVDQGPNSAARAAFSQDVLGRSATAMESHWRQQIFSGRGVPPPQRADDRGVVNFVLGHRGAIGYVASGTNLGAARVVPIGR